MHCLPEKSEFIVDGGGGIIAPPVGGAPPWNGLLAIFPAL